MKLPFHIAPVTGFRSDVEALRITAAGEGFRFLDRLVDEWASGINRFDKPGELLVGAFQDDSVIAVCGLNRDPYADCNEVGRLRHLYVHPSTRCYGVGSALVGHLLGKAKDIFRVVRLRTATPEATALYIRQGFVSVTGPTASHVKALY